MKKTLLFLFLGMMGLCQEMEATSPLRRVISVKQSDGTVLQVQKEGNGHFMYYTTTDGIALMRGANGDFQYAKVVADGLLASGVCAHETHLRSTREIHLLSQEGLRTQEAFQWLSSLHTPSAKQGRGMGNLTKDGIGEYGKSGSGIVKSIGAPTIPVIMVEFPDRKFMEITTKDKVSRMLNEPGYDDEEYCKGSVKDYFTSQSNGMFVPSYDVVAKVQVSKPYAEYGKNASNGSIDLNVKKLIKEAIDSACVAGVDFKKYAKDAGRVPLVSIYYAGPGEHSSFEKGCEDYIWAHFSETAFTTLDGVGINSYFVGNEMLQSYKPDANGNPVVKDAKFDGIGIFCHEFGHALGLPDFYQTRGSEKIETPDFWSVMDYGQYFFDGYAPIGYSAFERSSLGWIDIQELKEPQYAELYAFGQEDKGPTAYCIKNDANEKEYYILENRQPGTWYPALMGQGMLITHVDFDASLWSYNAVNNDKDHQRYEVIPADNVKSGYEDSSRKRPVWDYFKADLFPGLKHVDAFTDTTTPASKVFTGTSLNKPLYNIKEYNGVVSFSFKDKNITGIQSVGQAPLTGEQEIYTLTGRKLLEGSVLVHGVYLMKEGGKVRKIYVK